MGYPPGPFVVECRVAGAGVGGAVSASWSGPSPGGGAGCLALSVEASGAWGAQTCRPPAPQAPATQHQESNRPGGYPRPHQQSSAFCEEQIDHPAPARRARLGPAVRGSLVVTPGIRERVGEDGRRWNARPRRSPAPGRGRLVVPAQPDGVDRDRAERVADDVAQQQICASRSRTPTALKPWTVTSSPRRCAWSADIPFATPNPKLA